MPKVILKYGPVYTKFYIQDCNPSETLKILDVIKGVCKARPNGYQYMPKVRSGMWDGYISLCVGNTFPTGLTKRVLNALNSQDCEVKFNLDELPRALGVTGNLLKFENGKVLRDYQFRAFIDLINAYRGICAMPTGSGKTLVMARIAQYYNGRVVVLTTKKDIAHQTAQRFESLLGEPIGIVGDGEQDYSQRITVVIVQNAIRRIKQKDPHYLDFAHSTNCVLYDECHHAQNQISQTVLTEFDNAHYRFGFSATPQSDDKLKDLVLEGLLGRVIVDYSIDDLQQFLANVNVKMVEIICKDNNLTWQSAYTKYIVENKERNRIIANWADDFNGSCLIIVDRIEHGNNIKQCLPDAVFVNGSHSKQQRQDALNLLRNGNKSIVVATNIFDEGIDVPSVGLVIIAAGGVSKRRVLQRVGRGTRRTEDKDSVTVLDFIDYGNKHLERHSLKRVQLYEKQGFSVKVL